MKKLFLSLLLLVVFVFAASAQTEPKLKKERFQLHDAGQPREFVIAKDELHFPKAGPANRLQRIAPRATAEAIREYAENLERTQGDPVQLVLYEAGKSRDESSRRFLTDEIVVKLRQGADPKKLAADTGLVFKGRFEAAPEFYIFKATRTGGALEGAEALGALAEVELAEPQLARQQTKKLIPNDTFFNNQWHLRNTGQSGGVAGTDVNVVTTWDTFRGSGIRIGIVDDGLQLTHPDLSTNVDTVNDWDWNGNDADPSPNLSFDFHGTSCAGVAAARGNNALGVSGAAPEATLVGLRLISAPTTDSQEAEAMAWENDIIQVKSNSWGPSDNGSTLEGPGALTRSALATSVQNGRGGLGTIHVWAGGNGRQSNDNVNYDGYANSIYTIAVGALINTGLHAYYSEPGACVVVTAPSSGGTVDITTTDLVGNNGYNTNTTSNNYTIRDYTNDFGGTSSATPLVSGCLALMLQAKPTLGWRDVQEILIRTATRISPSDSDWINNGANFHFNHKFGAGLINVQAAIALSGTWSNLATQTSSTSTQSGINLAIPDNNTTGITRTFDFSSSNIRVEHVTVTATITHSRRGQLAVTLTSPNGTQSRLAEKHSDNGANYSSWTFSTVRNWGENSQGTWNVKVADLTNGNTGTLNSLTVNVYGTPAAPVNQSPSVTSAQVSPSGTAFFDQPIVVQSVIASDPEGDPITLAYQWQRTSDGVNFTDIAGATTSTLSPNPDNSGKLVRCRIIPTAGGSAGAPFFAEAVTVNRRPVQTAQHAQFYSYDSDLFLVGNSATFSRALIINEFSQGNGTSKEWVELLFLQDADVRGWTLADRNSSTITFSQNALWSNVPAGTLLVLYNGGDRDTILPADNTNIATKSLVIPHNNTTYFTGGWPALGNTGAESIVIRNAAAAIVDALSFNGDNVYDPKLDSVGANTAAGYNSNTDAGAEQIVNWSIDSATTSFATPGAGNGGINTQFVNDLRSGALNDPAQFRLAASSDVVPGLSIDAQSGLLSGVPNVTDGGTFNIIIERYTASSVVSQSYSLLVKSEAGIYRIQAGKIWKPTVDYSLAGNLLVEGTLDTNGTSLSIFGLIDVTGAVLNTAGTVHYFNRDGSSIPGQTRLIADPVNDVSDIDADGTPALLEFFLGMNPSVSSPAGLPTVSLNGQHLTITYSMPTGIGAVTGFVEVTGDLMQWNSGSGHTEIISDTTAGGFRTITVRDLSTGSGRAIRLKVRR